MTDQPDDGDELLPLDADPLELMEVGILMLAQYRAATSPEQLRAWLTVVQEEHPTVFVPALLAAVVLGIKDSHLPDDFNRSDQLASFRNEWLARRPFVQELEDDD